MKHYKLFYRNTQGELVNEFYFSFLSHKLSVTYIRGDICGESIAKSLSYCGWCMMGIHYGVFVYIVGFYKVE
jgi:hypothetical protein